MSKYRYLIAKRETKYGWMWCVFAYRPDNPRSVERLRSGQKTPNMISVRYEDAWKSVERRIKRNINYGVA